MFDAAMFGKAALESAHRGTQRTRPRTQTRTYVRTGHVLVCENACTRRIRARGDTVELPHESLPPVRGLFDREILAPFPRFDPG